MEYIIIIIVVLVFLLILIFILPSHSNASSTQPPNSTLNVDPPYPNIPSNCSTNINTSISYIEIGMELNTDGSGVFAIKSQSTLKITNYNKIEIKYTLTPGKNACSQNNTKLNMLSFTTNGNLINFITYTTDYTITGTMTLDLTTVESGKISVSGTGQQIPYSQYNVYNNTATDLATSTSSYTIVFNNGCGDTVKFNS